MHEATGPTSGQDPAERDLLAHAAYRPTAALDVMVEAVDDDLVIYREQPGGAFILNETGAAIWALCDGAATEEEIAREIAAAYGIDYRLGLAEVRVCLADLDEAGLLAHGVADAELRAARLRHAALERRALRFRRLTDRGAHRPGGACDG